MGLIMRIMDYRNAKAAKAAFNERDKKAGFDRIRQNPQLADVLLLMGRAQRGLPLESGRDRLADALQVAEAYREVEEEPDANSG